MNRYLSRAQARMRRMIALLAAALLPALGALAMPPTASAAPEVLMVPSPSMGRDIPVQFQGGRAEIGQEFVW